MRRSPSLQTQFIIAMVACVVATVVIALSTTTVLMNAQDAEFRAALSPEAVATQAAIAQGRTPSDEDALRELLAARQRVYGDESVLDGTVLAGIAVASILFGGLLGVGLARRLGRPLGEVSEAARRVAAGDLKARAGRAGALAGETLRLVDNFNAMAEALEGFQRRSVESSAAIAHELRTPLTILRGRLEGMREGLFPTDPPAVARLIAQVEALARIVDDLGTVSLAEAGQLRVTRRDVDLGAEVGALLDVVEPELGAEGLTLERALVPVQVWAVTDWEAVLRVNLTSAFVFARAVLPAMIAARRGCLLFTGSVAGLRPTSQEAAYAVSKAGVVQLARAIALDHARDGVRANALCPGLLEAVMGDRRVAMTATDVEARHAAAASLVPMGREGRYEEMARLALALCDEQTSGYVTGQAIVADGGFLLA